MQRRDRRQRRRERLRAGDVDRAGPEQRDHASELVEVLRHQRIGRRDRRRGHADMLARPARTARDRRCCRTGSPADARHSALARESTLRPLAPAARPPCRSRCCHGTSTLARSPRKIRSGACRAQCSSQSPTQRAPSRKRSVDFRTMLPSTRRSATTDGVANSVSEGSRLVAAADVIGFLRCLSVGGRRFPLREIGAVRQRVIAPEGHGRLRAESA